MDTSKLNDHIKDTHTFDCQMCSFEGTTVNIMENHILEKHFIPDENNKFSCDEYTFKCDNRDQLGSHLREKHSDKPSMQNVLESDNEEENKLKEELRLLKSNFK